MPTFKIETTAQVRRVYMVDAASAEEAEEYIDDHGADVMVHEEDISEEVDSVKERVNALGPRPTETPT
jgi:glycerol-3-phosphate cytidylyltransferase-like family protein